MLERLVAFPESKRILQIHLVATPFLAIQWAVVAMVPVLLRDYFAASAWQTTISTSAITVMSLLSVLWNEVYRRVTARRYLLLVWLVTIVPLAGIALCHRPATVLVVFVVSAAGFGAMTPLTADILRGCYPPVARGRVFTVLQMIAQVTLMVTTYSIGVWLKTDPEAFRVYLPVGILVVGLGMALLGRIAGEPLFQERHQAPPTEPLFASLRNACRSMVTVLAKDRSFRRYEAAFSIYGVGWMICCALLPFLVVDELGLNYEEVARSTQTTLQFTLLIMIMAAGHLMGRFGPIRICSWGFGVLVFYPLGLMLAGGVNSLTLVTIAYGVGISGVQLAWTIGPVTMARNPAQAPHYLAIHSTMVGFRSILGQFPGVALYWLTGKIEIPLAIAAASIACGALLMNRLDRDHRLAEPISADTVPLRPDQAEVG